MFICNICEVFLYGGDLTLFGVPSKGPLGGSIGGIFKV